MQWVTMLAKHIFKKMELREILFAIKRNNADKFRGSLRGCSN